MSTTAGRRLAPAVIGCLIAVGAACPGMAQDSLSGQVVAAHFTAPQAAAFSKQIELDLARRGVRIAIVFRTGRPHEKLPKGVGYTHGAFWIYCDIKTTGGSVEPGYAVYNLYAGDGKLWPVTTSRLVQDFPFNFTRGSAVDDVAVIIPSPEMQRRMLAVVDSPAYETLHNPSYSLIANPWSSKHQNCNSFMLDIVAAALWDTHDAAQIRTDLEAHYTPAVIPAGPIKRLLAPLSDPRLKTDDQQGPLRTATYESMAAFMRDNALLEAAYVLEFAPTADAASGALR